MQIYKFGGASIKAAATLKNVTEIISQHKNLVVVISAIDKTTNKLEKLVDAIYSDNKMAFEIFEKIKCFHFSFIEEAFPQNNIDAVKKKLDNLFDDLHELLVNKASENYDIEYDKIVSFGELLSSTIISEYLYTTGIDNKHIDVRDCFVTDSNYSDAKVLWDKSAVKAINIFRNNNIYITQGFIGRDVNNITTTLGREGSDYSATALAYLLDAESVTIWKDVPGIMNADPKWCSFAEKLDFLSYREAIELAFFGAKIIHPKTIKPIENKCIPLYVKSFHNPSKKGTSIKKLDYKLQLIPVYIRKENQTLISISPKDFSFVVEENISKFFGLFAKYRIKVNITQNSAISFSATIDGGNRNFNKLIKDLEKDYFVKYNDNLELITIRYYDNESINRMIKNKTVLMEQRSRTTARFVLET